MHSPALPPKTNFSHKSIITIALFFLVIFVTSCKPNASAEKTDKTPTNTTQSLTTQGITLEDGWAKATVTGQQASGAYMRISADQALRFLGGSSAAAQAVEVHEMRMEGDIMRMRALDFLEIPANTPVVLKPGGNHLMLVGLKEPLPAGSTLGITLRFSDAKGKILEVPTTLQVRSPAHDDHEHSHGHDHQH